LAAWDCDSCRSVFSHRQTTLDHRVSRYPIVPSLSHCAHGSASQARSHLKLRGRSIASDTYDEADLRKSTRASRMTEYGRRVELRRECVEGSYPTISPKLI
jgi:hypothetical protein